MCAWVGRVKDLKGESHAVCVLGIEDGVVRNFFESSVDIVPEVFDYRYLKVSCGGSPIVLVGSSIR